MMRNTMKSSVLLLLVSIAALDHSHAFTPPVVPIQRTSNANQLRRRSFPFATTKTTSLLHATNGDSSSPEKNAAVSNQSLRQAVTALQNDNDSPSSQTQFQHVFDLIEAQTREADAQQTENLRTALSQELLEFPPTSQARTDMTHVYQALQGNQQLRLFGAVGAPLAAGTTHQVPPPLLESILDMPMKALTPQPTNSWIWAGVALATLEAVISLALAIPLSTIVLSTMVAFIADRVLLNGALWESLLKVVSPGVQEKIVRHEAGHFLAAYLLGCPVEGIVLNAWAALRDKRFGHRTVSAGTSFFDPELSKQINEKRSVSRSTVDRYSIIVMAGIAAEADFYGRADGGAGDELSLVAFLSNLNAQSARETVWTPDNIRNQARWGALQAVLMLREYQPAYLALVETLQRSDSATLGECVWAIEQAAKEHNLKPLEQPLGVLVEEKALGTNGVLEKVVTWKKRGNAENGETRSDAMDTALPSLKVNNSNNNQTTKNNNNAAATTDPDSIATSLQSYRAQAEARLQMVEKELQELERNSNNAEQTTTQS